MQKADVTYYKILPQDVTALKNMANLPEGRRKMSELFELAENNRQSKSDCIFTSFLILHNQLSTAFDKIPGELSTRQFMTVLMLIRFGEKVPTLTELGKSLCCSRQNVKRIAGDLQKLGFVEFEQGKNNAILVKLTPKARAYTESFLPDHNATLQKLFADFSDTDINAFFYILKKFQKSIENFARTESKGEAQTE